MAAVLLGLLAGCSSSEAISLSFGVLLVFAGFLAFVVVWSGICLAVSFAWARWGDPALGWYRSLRPVPRALVRRLGVLLLFGSGTELLAGALASAGRRPVVGGLAGVALYLLLVRGLIVLALDAQAAVVTWCAREAQRLIVGLTPCSGDPRVGSVVRPGAGPTASGVGGSAPGSHPIESGPTCWTCGGANDGHAH